MDQQQANPRLSKRQRRAQGANPSNTWQQQPRIKSAGARARAYISYAGLADENGNKKTSSSAGGTDGEGGIVKRSSDLLDPQLDLQSPEVKFGRLLGGTDQRSRHHAVKMLREYLRARSDISSGQGLSELDLLKLWKGLWYTLYMADKVPVQDKLSKILAEMMWCLAGTEEEDEYAGQMYSQITDDGITEEGDAGEALLCEDADGDTMEIVEMKDSDDDDNKESSEGGIEGEENSTDEEDAMEDADENGEQEDEEQRIKDMTQTHCRGAHLVSLYVSTFLRTVRREWGNVDKHRVDKFYTAVRFMVSEAYKYMAKRHWNLGIIRLFNDVLYEEALSAETPGLTNGLRYHLIDICVDELAKVNKDAALPLTEATIMDCLEPFFALAQKAVDKNVQRRVMDNVLLKFLNEYSFVCPAAMIEDGSEEEEEAKALIFKQVHVKTVSQYVFEIASNNDTDERFRKSLYEMHKTFVRTIRAAGRDVDPSSYLKDEDDEEEAEAGDDDGDDGSANKTRIVDDGGKCEKNQDGSEEKVSKEQDVDAIVHKKARTTTSDNAEKDDADDITPAVTKVEPLPEKKKKRKKRKTKAEKESAKEKEVNDADPESPEKAVEEEKPIETKPKTKVSKKKRKKQGSEPTENECPDPAEAAEEEKPVVTAPKTKSLSKKKRKKQGGESTETTGNESADPPATPDVKTPEPKKRKKKKQKTPPAVDPRSMHSPDQVISPASSDDETAVDASASKRVSFGNMNRCKSHKASMKAMKTLDKGRWDTKSRTPDKGILRPKGDMPSEEKKRPPLFPSRKKRGRK